MHLKKQVTKFNRISMLTKSNQVKREMGSLYQNELVINSTCCRSAIDQTEIKPYIISNA